MCIHTQAIGGGVIDFASLTKAVGRVVRRSRSVLTTEDKVQQAVAQALTDQHIEFLREHSFCARDRADFFLPEYGFAIEIKKATMGQGDLRQIGRYLEHEECKGCIAIALRVADIPGVFLGKPIHAIELWKLLL